MTKTLNSKQAVSLLLAVVVIGATAFGGGVVAGSASSTSSSTAAAQTCLDGGTLGPKVPMNVSVAAIEPVFTSTPYSQYAYGSFYAFYKKYVGATGNITSNLGWLNTSVSSGLSYNSGWGHTQPLLTFLTSAAARDCGLILGKNLHVISDINVSNGALFSPNGSRMYDAIIMGHDEYVTQTEYDQFRLFVAAGGRLVAISSNEFYAKVKFNPRNQMETFVTGHGGYAFNGRTAWYGKNVLPPWNTSRWFGSTFCCFKRFQYHGGAINQTNPVGHLLSEYFGDTLALGYTTHEENAVSNRSKTSIVATFSNQSGVTVASYIHGYGRGAVFCLCIFGEDLISYEKSTQYFIVASLIAASPGLSPSFAQSLGKNPFLYILVVATALGLVVVAIPVYNRVRRARIKT